MDTLVFDGRMGASGDMILGALLGVGGDPSVLQPIESALGVHFAIDTVDRSGIGAVAVAVKSVEDDRTIEGRGTERTVSEVIEVVESMAIDPGVVASATECFRRLGRAESTIHDTPLETIHFHEVGADDAIADIVGACLLIDELAIDRILTTPVAAGGGTVRMIHGEFPVPGPAVLEIAKEASWTLRGGPVDAELLTPTGAAILSQFADGVDWLPSMDVRDIGYGAGSHRNPDRPNVLRAIRGRIEGPLRREEIVVLETNVDDVTPEVLGSLQDRLGTVGALDVSVVPLTMKKSRPGHLLKVITRPTDAERVAEAIARETGTLGVRSTGTTHRWIADRERHTVTIVIEGERHEVAVKVATDGEGRRYDVSAEFDDADRVAADSDYPVREILRMAEAAYERADDG